MFTYVLTGLIAYYIYTNVSTLLAHEGPFTSLQWIMLGMTALFCVLFVVMVRRCIAQNKMKKQEKIDQEKAKSEGIRNEDAEIVEVDQADILEQDAQNTDDDSDSSKSVYDE